MKKYFDLHRLCFLRPVFFLLAHDTNIIITRKEQVLIYHFLNHGDSVVRVKVTGPRRNEKGFVVSGMNELYTKCKNIANRKFILLAMVRIMKSHT